MMDQPFDNSCERKTPRAEGLFSPSHWPFWVCLCSIFAIGLIARLMNPVGQSEWMDRDIQRTLGLISGQHIPLVGPEMNSGGFLPGPFLYVFLSPALIISKSPYSIVYYNQILNIASIVFLFFTLRKLYSPFAVLVSIALMSFSIIHISGFSISINPSFIFILNAIMFYFFTKIFISGEEWYFLPAAVLIALGTQVHFSFSAYGISLAVLTIFVRRVKPRVFSFSVVCALLTFIPYGLFQFLTKGVTLTRNYQEVSVSRTMMQFLPKDIFCRIFPTIPSAMAWSNARQIMSYFSSRLASSISQVQVSRFLWFTVGIELMLFVLASGLSLLLFVDWGFDNRYKFSPNQRKLIVPFLAVFPLILLWQWTGFARHPHHWYGYIFFPFVPVWIGVSLDSGVDWFGDTLKMRLRKFFLVAIFLLGLKPILYRNEGFFKLAEVIADIRDIKAQLGLPLDRYRSDVCYLDRPCSGKPGEMDPPFQYPPWGTYTDYLYGAVTSDIQSNEAPKEKRYLVGHREMVEYYTLNHYLEKIHELYGVNPERIFQSSRFVFFEYAPLTDGNCFHNTVNAWVCNERMNYSMGKIRKGDESALLGPKEFGNAVQNGMEFAVHDRKSNLPMNVTVLFKNCGSESAVKVTLDSGQLMGHLNATPAYSGLFRAWPALWIRNPRLVVEKDGRTIDIKIAEGDVGRFLFTPLSSPFVPVGFSLSDGHFKLALVYNTVASGMYRGRGKDIQSLANNMDAKQEWETAIHLYDEERGSWPVSRHAHAIPDGVDSLRSMRKTAL